jgi:hypothetical protein
METTAQNPLTNISPYLDPMDPRVRMGVMGLPAPAQSRPQAPAINASPEAPKLGSSSITSVPPTMEGTRSLAAGLKPTPPPVTAAPTGAAKIAGGLEHDLDITKFKEAHPWGSKASSEIDPSTGQAFAGNHDSGLGRFLHGAAKVANVAGSILMPNTTAMIPGSGLNMKLQEGSDMKHGLAFEKQADDDLKTKTEAFKAAHPEQAGKTNDEKNFADLMTGDSGGPRVNPATKQPYTASEANQAIKQQGPDTKTDDPMKSPVGDAGSAQHTEQLGTLADGVKMSPAEKATFQHAYGVKPNETLGEANKRLESAKASAGLSSGERDREVQRVIAAQNHRDTIDHQDDVMGLETVQYKGKDGKLYIGSNADAKKEGGTNMRKVQPGDEQKSRTAYTQFSRWLGNAQAVNDSMGAWDNPQDKELAIHVMHNASANIHMGVLNVDTEDLQNALLNNADYAKMSHDGQTHMQNMATLWSDAINLMKQETGGVPRGEHFLKLESQTLPQPEKTQDQNRQALKQFEQRVRKDSEEFARPNDMAPLVGIVPHDATHHLKNKEGQRVGYVDKSGKDVLFDKAGKD